MKEMKEMKEIKKMKTKHNIICVLILAAGILAGWLLSGIKKEAGHEPAVTAGTHVWTCAMHPHVRRDKPGKCPICAMDLIPLKTVEEESDGMDPATIRMSDEAVALANIQTTTVRRGRAVREIRLFGTIQPDERLVRTLVSHVSGRIEKLHVNFTGETVHAGQVIAGVYSPELLNAQQELLEAVKTAGTQPALLQAAREKLGLWKLTAEQIAAIEQSGHVSPLTDIVAGTGGIVTAKNVEQGDYVGQGSVLFTLTGLSSVWAVFDAYEADLPWIKTGNEVEYTLQAIPGEIFRGRISFIDPFLDQTTRTARIRVETPNPAMRLKPGMYAAATLKASTRQGRDEIIIPRTAVLWTGKRSVVYVRQPDAGTPAFQLREIMLGTASGDSYTVVSGIAEGEEIVTNGVFSIDASAQLEGKRSMMNERETAEPPSTGHHAMLGVEGRCEMCRERIEAAAKSVKGVTSAAWNSETKQLHLHFDTGQTSAEAISKAVAGAGHDTGKHRADNSIYDALPECCKYRE
jgi:Cu(I)/Ag(I) efflux system membrane fusion protein